MVEWIYELEGRAIGSDRRPAGDVYMEVYDHVQGDQHALIAVGRTCPDGGFRLSFTTSSFQQGGPPFKPLPRLVLVFWWVTDGHRQPIHVERVLSQRFDGFRAHVGEIKLPLRGDFVASCPELIEVPSRSFDGRKTRLDPALAALALEEVAPRVEQITGFSGLLRGISISLVDELEGSPSGVRMGSGETVVSALARSIRMAHFNATAHGQYKHTGRVVVVHRKVAEQNNLDHLKIVIGHELVHAGQYTLHPELEDDESEPQDEAALKKELRTSANVEGYAYYVERRLHRYYPLGHDLPPVPPTALRDRALDWASDFMSSHQALGDLFGISDSYRYDLKERWKLISQARDLYVSRSRGDEMVRFDPNVAEKLG